MDEKDHWWQMPGNGCSWKQHKNILPHSSGRVRVDRGSQASLSNAHFSNFMKYTTEEDVVVAAEELRYAANAVGKVTGAIGVEDVLDVVFREFCIGK